MLRKRCLKTNFLSWKVLEKSLICSTKKCMNPVPATAILFYFQHVSLIYKILLSLVIFLSKRDSITIVFKSFDFSVDSFAFSTKICLFLSFPQMFMAVLKSNSESSGPCIEAIINPCNMVLVSLFVPQCCLHSGYTTESPFTFNTLDKRAV